MSDLEISPNSAGSGDMLAATYDPATISEQLVGLTAAQTLTNKTLTTPKFADLGYIADTSGNELLTLDSVASAANYLIVANAATGFAPSITASGDDANVNMYLVGKGTGGLIIADGGYANSLVVNGNGGTPVNYTTITNSDTLNPVAIAALGTDTNIGIELTPKGSGRVTDGGVNIPTISSTDTLTNKTIDADNNTISNLAPSMADTTGSDVLFVSGTAGTASDLAIWNGDGDLVDGPTPPSGTIVGTTDTQTLTNKTLTSPIISTISNTGTLTLPTSTDTLVGKATTDTLTNKTLTDPRIGTYIKDTNGANSMHVIASGSAVNYLGVRNRATGAAPKLEALGADADINFEIIGKGAGVVYANGAPVATTTGTQTLTNKTLTYPAINTIRDTTNNGNVLVITGYASPTAYWRFYNGAGATTTTMLLTAEGTATNINVRHYVKGSGVFQFYVPTGQSTTTISGIGADGNINLNLTSQGTGVVKANSVEVATISGTQTLTNKTLTSPVLNGTLTGTAATATSDESGSISYETGWSAVNAYLTKVGNLCILTGSWNKTNMTDNEDMFTLPSGHRPIAGSIYGAATSSTADNTARVDVSSDGIVTVRDPTSSMDNIVFALIFPTA